MSIDNKSSITNHVEIVVHATTANLGPLFDIAGAALRSPFLIARLERAPGEGIKLKYESRLATPSGRKRGFAGVVALKKFMKNNRLRGSVLLSYKEGDDGYPTGGTGLSGAEAAGAVMAGAVMFDQVLTPEEAMSAAAKGEPGGHMDNVAPSILGGIVLISRSFDGKPIFRKILPPKNLGFAIGYSSHQKTSGTEGARNVLEEPSEKKLLFTQTMLVAAEVSALESGDVDRFLEVVWQDQFHELRRADAGLYGNFNAGEFRKLKKDLYEKYRIGLAVSGAGPSMGFWYNKRKYIGGIPDDTQRIINKWFYTRGIDFRIEDVGIANHGAYDYAVNNYKDSALSKMRNHK